MKKVLKLRVRTHNYSSIEVINWGPELTNYSFIEVVKRVREF